MNGRVPLGSEYTEKRGSKKELQGSPSSTGWTGRGGHRRKSQQMILKNKKVIEIMWASWEAGRECVREGMLAASHAQEAADGAEWRPQEVAPWSLGD